MKDLLNSITEGSNANTEAISNEVMSYFKIIQQISYLLSSNGKTYKTELTFSDLDIF